MNRRVKGRCFRETCERRAKIEQACRLCDEVIKSCQFHRDRAHGELRDHIIRNHPVEFREAQRQGPVQDAARPPGLYTTAPVFTPVKR